MLWFLERHTEVLVCEIRQGPDGARFELVISAPGLPERVEQFDEPSALLERWLAYQQELRARGWRART